MYDVNRYHTRQRQRSEGHVAVEFLRLLGVVGIEEEDDEGTNVTPPGRWVVGVTRRR